jgi:hypothetical protein
MSSPQNVQQLSGMPDFSSDSDDSENVFPAEGCSSSGEQSVPLNHLASRQSGQNITGMPDLIGDTDDAHNESPFLHRAFQVMTILKIVIAHPDFESILMCVVRCAMSAVGIIRETDCAPVGLGIYTVTALSASWELRIIMLDQRCVIPAGL